MEKFREKTYFMGQLALPDGVREEILTSYYGDESHLFRDYSRHRYMDQELKMYKELLLIARTCYFSKEEQEALRLVPEGPFELYVGDFENYYVCYRPEYLDGPLWSKLRLVFASMGLLRPYGEVKDINWAEVDFAFSYILNNFADPELDMTVNFAIGHLHPKSHEDYEAFLPDLTRESFARLYKYLCTVNVEWVAAPDIYLENYRSGDFAGWLLSNAGLCQKIARTETLVNIDKIYRGLPVTLTF